MYLAQAGFDTLLLEEGENPSTSPFSLEEMVAKYRDRGQTMTWGRPIVQYVEGCCLGGGSEINSGLYHRLPEEIRAKWELDLNIKAFSSNILEHHCQACEELLMVEKHQTAVTKASLKLLEGANRLAWKCVEVPRWYKASGERNSMHACVLPKFSASGGRILTGAKASHLQQRGDGWSIASSKGEIQAQFVFVCAGAVQTPFLLRRSGIKQNIGNSLRLHPTVKLTALFEEEINEKTDTVPVHQVKEFAPTLSLGGSISRLPHLMAQFTHHRGFPDRFLTDSKKMFTYYAMVASDTKGKIRKIPFCSSPLVVYKLSEMDWRLLELGQKRLAELLLAAGAKRLFAAEGVEASHLSDLPAKVAGVMTVHLAASCPMGENLGLCATDSFGKVHGFSNLYIADASLLGGAPTVNPQGIIMAIARRNVFHFLESQNKFHSFHEVREWKS
jgi:choline dehydrogenase-like flavoprotein